MSLPSTCIGCAEGEGPSAPKHPKPAIDTKTKIPPPLPMNLLRLFELTSTDEKTIAFSQDHGLLPRFVTCPTCECRLDVYKKQGGAGRLPYYRFACYKRQCRRARTPNEVSLKKGTWFEGSLISMQKSLVLAYCFIASFSIERTIIESSITSVTSGETVVDYFNYCREVCVESLYDGSEVQQIGGQNCTVEIDEARFHNKRFRRHLQEGEWILGGLCRESKKCFLIPVEDRTELTLISTIKRFVKQGSIIDTDCLPLNGRLQEEGYHHININHSEVNVDPNTGACTNIIGNTWRAFRRTLPNNYSGKRSLAMHLAEYMWRKTHREGDIFISFLRAISKMYPGIQQ